MSRGRLFVVRFSYRLTVKLFAPLTPPAVRTLTLSLPKAAVAGTLQRILVALQARYLPQAFLPNLTTLVPRLAPKPEPVMVTVEPRYHAMLGLGIAQWLCGQKPGVNARTPAVERARELGLLPGS